MTKKSFQELYTGFIFGEGKRDKNFLTALIDLEKFKYHTSKWTFNYSNSSGGSAETILEKCHKESSPYAYDLILCFIDLDKLKEDFPKTWGTKKIEFEKKYENIQIIWQIDNAEDEYKKVLGEIGGKHRLNQEAKKQVDKFINSDFWKRTLTPIKNKEKNLDERKKG